MQLAYEVFSSLDQEKAQKNDVLAGPHVVLGIIEPPQPNFIVTNIYIS